jgi:hypothetical protein
MAAKASTKSSNGDTSSAPYYERLKPQVFAYENKEGRELGEVHFYDDRKVKQCFHVQFRTNGRYRKTTVFHLPEELFDEFRADLNSIKV